MRKDRVPSARKFGIARCQKSKDLEHFGAERSVFKPLGSNICKSHSSGLSNLRSVPLLPPAPTAKPYCKHYNSTVTGLRSATNGRSNGEALVDCHSSHHTKNLLRRAKIKGQHRRKKQKARTLTCLHAHDRSFQTTYTIFCSARCRGRKFCSMIMAQVHELTPELFICLWVEIIWRVHHQARNALIVPHTDLGISKSPKLSGGFTVLSNDSTLRSPGHGSRAARNLRGR